MGKKLDLIGQRFGRLVALYECGKKNGHIVWKCHCDCGNECVVQGALLKNGHTQSCGCYNRDRLRACNTLHGLNTGHRRLTISIRKHFKWISEGLSGYRGWKLDARYSNDAQGVSKFCSDLIAIQPEMAELYESDHSLDVDKDNGEKIFKPECVVFCKSSENRSKKCNNVKLLDSTRLIDFCHKLGYKTCENGKQTLVYARFLNYFIYHNGEGHPELLKKANDLIALYSKCLKLLKLRDEVRQFAEMIAH